MIEVSVMAYARIDPEEIRERINKIRNQLPRERLRLEIQVRPVKEIRFRKPVIQINQLLEYRNRILRLITGGRG